MTYDGRQCISELTLDSDGILGDMLLSGIATKLSCCETGISLDSEVINKTLSFMFAYSLAMTCWV